ncbi:MAG: hypothetical protein Q8Q15_01250, partial [bacterium]|nr:hypothetical protein [bacterium]
MKEFIWPSISRKELSIVLSLACCAIIFYLTPTIWAYLKTPPGFWFVGFNFIHDPWDVNSYLANIRQGFNGRWLYQNPYATVPTEPIPIYFFYIFLGHLAKIFSLPILWIYH